MVCVGEGRLFDGMRRRDGFWSVASARDGLGGVRRFGTAFVGVASAWDG